MPNNTKTYSVVKNDTVIKDEIKNLVSAKELAKKENAEVFCNGKFLWKPEACPIKKYTIKTLLNIRKEPSLEAENTGILKVNSVVEASEFNKDWLKISDESYIYRNGGIFAEEIQ